MPYYLKEGGNFRRWNGRPTDVMDNERKSLGVKICGTRDQQQIGVSVLASARNYVLEDTNDVIFPDEGKKLKEEGFCVVESATGKPVARVIYSREPIEVG
jgi:hypothetical protein